MPNKSALIIIDSGFNEDVLARCQHVIGICDVYEWRTIEGDPSVDRETLRSFAWDPLKHGTLVLERLLECAPGAPLILVRAYGPDRRLIRTQWQNGQQSAPGWTEAYLWAVDLARKRGLTSVGNCSFGGFTHAMDGTGWESFQLGRAIGRGKPGHLLVAAAGPGDGRATHSSWLTAAGSSTAVELFQRQSSQYNFWVSDADPADWKLEIWQQATLLRTFQGIDVPPNIWNRRQQVTFYLDGYGDFRLVVSRRDTASGGRPVDARFDCWVVGGGGASFIDHVDATLIAEPACFPQVLSAGLRGGTYSPSQSLPGGKPDILVSGGGPISFRLPEVTAAAGRLLADEPSLDCDGARALLGKYPDLSLPAVD